MKFVLSKTALFIFTSAIILSCGVQKKSLHKAHIYNYKPDSVEIEIPYIEKGVGNVHTWSLRRWKNNASDWIYISKQNSTASADSILITVNRREFQFPYRHLKGKIILSEKTLTIDLMVPEYNAKGDIEKWEKHELNGRYKLR